MPDASTPTSTPLHRYAVVTATATFCLLIAGSLVTSTDSGLAVPDWPLSYGTWFPPMVGGILYEHGHRMLAGLVGLMILGLTVWLWRTEPRRWWLKRLGAVALGGVIAQALLGGLTVLLLLPPQISIAHACLGQAVFCLIASLAHGTSPAWAVRGAGAAWPGVDAVRRLSLIIAVLAVVQLLLGAVIRHTGYAVLPHIVVACLIGLHVALIARRVLGSTSTPAWLKGHVVRLIGLTAGQLGLGVAVFTHRASVPARTGHVAVGALILAQAVLLAWDALRIGRATQFGGVASERSRASRPGLAGAGTGR